MRLAFQIWQLVRAVFVFCWICAGVYVALSALLQ